jgi:hypothetical protein
VSAQIITRDERVISAWFEGERVTIYVDGVRAGIGRWTGTRLGDCAARRVATTEETEELYAALDRALLADWTGIES